jgi:hypothetical protein
MVGLMAAGLPIVGMGVARIREEAPDKFRPGVERGGAGLPKLIPGPRDVH